MRRLRPLVRESLPSSTVLDLATARVVAVFVAPCAGAAPTEIPRVEAVHNVGLAGDRYAAGVGSFSRWPGSGRAVTLIESEALAAIRRECGLDFAGGLHRRNVVTAGVR